MPYRTRAHPADQPTPDGAMDKFGALIRTGRPRQWTKNIFVFAAVLFSGRFTEAGPLLETAIAFVSLSLFSSAVYIVNDVRDAELDRAHPVKRTRPIASGELDEATAWVGALAFAFVALVLGWLAGPMFLLALGIYLLLQLLYASWLKDVVILDIMAIAAGFTIRAVAGAWAIEVPISPWLLIVTALLALFLGAAKRRHELLLLGEGSGGHRPVLAHYTPALLDQILSTLSAATITAYALYTFFSDTVSDDRLMLTVPFVLYGVLRYQYLVHSKNQGGAPEEILLKDRPIQLTVLLWFAASALVMYSTRVW